MLDLVLKSSELAFLAPVVKRRYQDDDHHCDEDRNTFDPLRLRLGIVMLFYNNNNNYYCNV